MNVIARPAWTLDSALAWEREQEGRYESDGEDFIDMNGGTLGRSFIALRFVMALQARLDPDRLTVLPGGAKVLVGRGFRYPDALVLMSGFGMDSDIASNPLLVAEVLSPSTERTDRTTKRHEYAAADSILYYVILSQDRRLAIVHSRRLDGWTSADIRPGASIELPLIAAAVPLDEIYAGLALAT